MKTATTLLAVLGAALALSACSRSDPPKPAASPPAATSSTSAAVPAAAATAAATPAAPAPPTAAAQTSAASLVPPAPAEPAGSAEAGQQIAASGGANGVTACVACHGAQGEGNPAGGFPRIAGQSQYYLAKQLTAFAKETRNNPVMTPIAKAMSEQQMRDVSAYYASAEAPVTSPAPGTASSKPAAGAMERGRLLAGVGDESRHVQACANCHGPAGAGEAPSYPYLAGQHAGYLSAALTEWKGGARNTDASGQMPAIAKLLSDQDIAALAAFYSAQQPPAPAGRMINVAAGSAARPAVAAAPDAAGPKTGEPAPMQGVGSEQGSPVTGGSQGIGGGGGGSGAGPTGSK
jgi:cytochrome c553